MKNRIIIWFCALVLCPWLQAQETDFSLFENKFNFFVANDLGRNGYYDQKPIAERMGQMAEQGVDPEFVLAAGDVHHFEGVQSVHDPLWMTNFETVYSHPELMIDWFPVLGNHEYRGNSQAVLDYSEVSRRWEMRARYYTKVFEDQGMTLRVVWLDTAPLIDKYRLNAEEYPDAGRQNAEEQLAWLDSVLTVSKTDWVIVAGHHPIYAQTSKAEAERTDLQKRLDPILRRHAVDMYICGHIHNFQHIRRADCNIDYITNSSASLSRKVKPTEGTVFCSDAAGFSIVSADARRLVLRMVDKEGRILHSVMRTAKK